MQLGYLPWLLAERFGEAAALADEDQSLGFGEVDRRSEAFAAQLAELGFGAGDVLGIMLPNRVELVVAITAAWRLGGAATPVNPAFTADEAGHQLADSGARLVVTVEPTDALPAPAIPVGAMRLRTDRPVPPVALTGSELALLIYTSGSTGRPKGVMLDHDNLEAMSSAMVEHFGLTAADHCLLVLPLFHVNALMVSTFSPLRCGGRCGRRTSPPCPPSTPCSPPSRPTSGRTPRRCASSSAAPRR